MARAIKIILALVVLAVGGLMAFPYLAPERAASLAVNGERSKSGLTRREVTLDDGLQYVYLEGGQESGSGEAMVLLHGFGGNKDNFTRIAKFLTPHYRVIIPDHIGFGESSHPQTADYKPPAQAERLHRLIEKLGIKTAHVGGNSMGGAIAATWAALYPQDVKSLWLLAPAGVWSAPKSELVEIIEKTGKNPLLVQNEDDFAAILPFVMTDPPYIPTPIAHVFAQERIKNYALEQTIIKQLVTDTIEQRVAGLQTPALIVWGEKDRLLNVGGADILKKLMPNAQVSLLPGIGHVPQLERIEGSAQDYLAFLSALK